MMPRLVCVRCQGMVFLDDSMPHLKHEPLDYYCLSCGATHARCPECWAAIVPGDPGCPCGWQWYKHIPRQLLPVDQSAPAARAGRAGWLSVAEIAVQYDLAMQYVRQLIKRGDLAPAERLLGPTGKRAQWCVQREAVEAWARTRDAKTTCAQCGKEMPRYGYRMRVMRYCSADCQRRRWFRAEYTRRKREHEQQSA